MFCLLCGDATTALRGGGRAVVGACAAASFAFSAQDSAGIEALGTSVVAVSMLLLVLPPLCMLVNFIGDVGDLDDDAVGDRGAS